MQIDTNAPLPGKTHAACAGIAKSGKNSDRKVVRLPLVARNRVILLDAAGRSPGNYGKLNLL